MSRSDQWIGLNDWALEFLRRSKTSEELTGEVEGAWSTVAGRLRRYTLANGSVVEEFQQATPWQSGPMYFIALRHADGSVIKETLWTDHELDGDGRFYEWTQERGYLEALEPTAFEAGRYLLALLRRDEIGAMVYGKLLDNCLYGLDYHEREVGLPFTSTTGELDEDYPRLLIRIGQLAQTLRESQEWKLSEIGDLGGVMAALGSCVSSWAEIKQAARAELYADCVDVELDA